MSDRGGRRSGVVLGVVLVVLVVGGVVAVTRLRSEGGTRVLVVGDSVTRLATEELRRQFSGADDVDVRAYNGFRTDELVGPARDGMDAGPSVAVFMPGYNDILQETVDTPALAEMAEIAAGTPCAVWLLLPIEGVYSSELAEQWNQRVEEALAGRDGVHVSGAWRDRIADDTEHRLLSDDGLHPNEEGAAALAEVMARAAERSCPDR